MLHMSSAPSQLTGSWCNRLLFMGGSCCIVIGFNFATQLGCKSHVPTCQPLCSDRAITQGLPLRRSPSSSLASSSWSQAPSTKFEPSVMRSFPRSPSRIARSVCPHQHGALKSLANYRVSQLSRSRRAFYTTLRSTPGRSISHCTSRSVPSEGVCREYERLIADRSAGRKWPLPHPSWSHHAPVLVRLIACVHAE